MKKQSVILYIVVCLVLVFVLASLASANTNPDSFLPIVVQGEQNDVGHVSTHCLYWRHGATVLNWSAPGNNVFCDEAFRDEYGTAVIDPSVSLTATTLFAETFSGEPIVQATGTHPDYAISVDVAYDRVTFVATPLTDTPEGNILIYWQARGANLIFVK